MVLQKKLRDIQDRVRNAGWRIKSIPWQESGRPEYVYNTPLTLVTGFGGAALFIGAAGHVFFPIFRSGKNPEPAPEELYVTIGVAISGLAIILLGRLWAAISKQAGWQKVTACCIDREIQKRYSYSGGKRSTSWEYRLLCTFHFNYRSYEVTPEASHTVAFMSERKVEEYLEERIRPDGTCRLWIDLKNPLHAVFHKKQKI